MKQKTVSQLDAEGYFIGPVLADESPLEPGVYLIPGGAIDRAPPANMQAGKRYRPWGNGWRGEDMPQPEPEPLPPEPTRVELIRRRLSAIDFESIRPARAVAAALASGQAAPAFDARKLAQLELEAQALRQELAAQ